MFLDPWVIVSRRHRDGGSVERRPGQGKLASVQERAHLRLRSVRPRLRFVHKYRRDHQHVLKPTRRDFHVFPRRYAQVET